MSRTVPLGDLVISAPVERAGNRTFAVLSMTRAGGLVPQESVFKKVIASGDLSKYKIVRPNQLVVGIHIDEGALGFSGPDQIGIVSPAYTLWDLNKAEEVHIPYLHRFIRSSQAIKYFISKYRETAERRGKLTREQFLALNIPLPPLAEQKRIAGILDEADALRTKRRESIEQLDTLLQSTFLDMFGDIYQSATIGEMLSDGTLSSHKDGNHGSLYPRAHEFGEQGVPFLTAKCVSEHGDLLPEEVQFLHEEKAHALKIGWIKPGDVLLAHNASVGKTLLYRGQYNEALIGTSLTAFRPNREKLDPTYLLGALQEEQFQNQLFSMMSQTTRNQVPITAQRRLSIPLPPIELQRRFSFIVESIEDQRSKLRTHLAELDTLFSSLQHRAFNGEL
ncbi:MAG: restriction endonuclease subunit S [Bacteroidetes bacterium]|nr:restriction endonuclease subunit S [Bacteroidota bacterium]